MRPRPATRRRLAGRRRWVWLAGLGLALTVLATLLVVRAFGQAAQPPVYSREAALAAVDHARRSGAAQWANVTLREAQHTLEASLTEYRRQQLRLVGTRDFTEAREGLRRAEERAELAADLAVARLARARADAAAAMDQAQSLVTGAEAAARVARLPLDARGSLQRARLAWSESQFHYDQGEFVASAASARRAAAEASNLLQKAAGKAARFVDHDERARWRRWVEETITLSKRGGSTAIIVSKDDKRVRLYQNGRVVRTYKADLGRNNLARKLTAGDEATPEGRYRVTEKRGVGRTRYYKALMLDYPNAEDRERLRQAAAAGQVSRRATPGGQIEIHGDGGRGTDWTRGCIALSNSDMDDLFARVAPGTPVTIVGVHGSDGAFSALARAANGGADAAD